MVVSWGCVWACAPKEGDKHSSCEDILYLFHNVLYFLLQFLQSFVNHACYIVVYLVVLLQAHRYWRIELLVHGYIYIRQKDETACQPVGIRCALVDEIKDFLFCRGIITGIVPL